MCLQGGYQQAVWNSSRREGGVEEEGKHSRAYKCIYKVNIYIKDT